MSLLCLLRGWWLSFRYAAPISGHYFIEQENGDLLCETCGEISRSDSGSHQK